MIWEGTFFRFVYAKADKDLLGAIVSTAEDTYASVAKQLRLSEEKERFTFTICPDIASFLAATGKTEETYRPWMVGWADYGKRRLCILSPRVAEAYSLEEMLKIVKHEVVHVVFDSLGNPEEAPIGISEGIAVCMAGQIEPNELDVHAYPSMLQLNEEAAFYENDGYRYSGVYVQYFLKKFGMDAFRNVYTGKDRLAVYLYDGFEAEAIQNAKA